MATLISILEDVSQELAHFQNSQKLNCLPGCGACCLSPNVEATVFEMLPVAELLLEQGRAEDLYSQILTQVDGPCVLYTKHSLDGEKGKCSAYSARPFICRLFGAYWLNDKYGEKRLSLCTKIRQAHPEQADAVELAGPQGGEAQLSKFWNEISSVSPELLGARYPINMALKLALEKTLLQHSLQKEAACMSEPSSSPLS